MATSKVKTKAKLKKGMSRITKMKLGNTVSCEADNSDLSQLRKPIDINMTSLRQIAQLFEKGSDEVRDILTYECDVIYECKICRSLFRSLANLISHKRVYCLQKFSVKPSRNSADPTESIYSKNYNNDRRTFFDVDNNENCSNDRILRSQATRKEPKKDLTSVIDMLMTKKNNDECEDNCNETQNTCPLRIASDNEQVLLEMMDSNKAAYQTILPLQIPVSNNDDLMKTQTEELKDMSNRTAVLGPDGQCQEVCSNILGNGVQDENDFDFETHVLNAASDQDLTCPICNIKFSTKKTLTFHIKCKHTSHAVGYPCPCCSNTFSNRWSVYRHLFKVHRKPNDQVRKLRPQIKARAFCRDPSRLEKSSKSGEAADQNATEQAQNLIIAQDWMENLELDTELQRCGACGKRFERKAALASHSLICKERDRTCTKFKGRFKRASKNPPQRIVPSPENCVSDQSSPTSSTTTADTPPRMTDVQKLTTSDLEPPQAASIDSEPPIESIKICLEPPQAASIDSEPSIESIKICLEPPQSASIDSEPPIENIKICLEPPQAASIDSKPLKESIKICLEPPQAASIDSEPLKESMEIAIQVKDVSSLSKDVWDRIGDDNCANDSGPVSIKTESLPSTLVNQSDSPAIFSSQEIPKVEEASPDLKASHVNDNLDVPEVIYTSIDSSRPVALSVLDKETKLGIQYRGVRLPTVTLEKINIPTHRGSGAPIAPPSTTNGPPTCLESAEVDKMLRLHANVRKLQCLPCNRKFNTLLSLRRHIAVHKRRSRFSCRICDFKAFLKCDFVAHCNKKHNAKNNRKILSQMIIEMPMGGELGDMDDETIDTLKLDDLEVIDVPKVIPSVEDLSRKSEILEWVDEKVENKDSSANELIPTDPPVKLKPRRGRPPKSRRVKKGVKRGRILKRPRHVSPPKLNDDLFESAEIENFTNSANSVDQLSKKSVEFSRLRAPSRMDCDPELRKMVMEVIFGPAEKPIDYTEKQSSNGNIKDEIAIEQINTNALDHREDGQISNSQSADVNKDQQIGGDKTEGIQSNRISLSNNNSQYETNNISIKDDITIVEDVVLERISTNGELLELQSHDVSLGHPEAITSLPRETVRLYL